MLIFILKRQLISLPETRWKSNDKKFWRLSPDVFDSVEGLNGRIEISFRLVQRQSVLEMHLPLSWAEKLKVQTLKKAGEGRRAKTVFKLFSATLPVAVNMGGNKITGTEARFSALTNRMNIGGSVLAMNQCVITIDQKNRLLKMSCL